jgi:nicotinamidase-related amidase
MISVQAARWLWRKATALDVANTLIDWCQARGEPVLATQDWHPANHGSFASQPVAPTRCA